MAERQKRRGGNFATRYAFVASASLLTIAIGVCSLIKPPEKPTRVSAPQPTSQPRDISLEECLSRATLPGILLEEKRNPLSVARLFGSEPDPYANGGFTYAVYRGAVGKDLEDAGQISIYGSEINYRAYTTDRGITFQTDFGFEGTKDQGLNVQDRMANPNDCNVLSMSWVDHSLQGDTVNINSRKQPQISLASNVYFNP